MSIKDSDTGSVSLEEDCFNLKGPVAPLNIALKQAIVQETDLDIVQQIQITTTAHQTQERLKTAKTCATTFSALADRLPARELVRTAQSQALGVVLVRRLAGRARGAGGAAGPA
jgi:hypothetical protein